jgi:hypothetical protein
MQIQICSNHGTRGWDGATIGKSILCVYNGENLQQYSSPDSQSQIQSNLIQYYPWVMEIQVCSNKGSGLQRGDNNKNANIGCGNLKNIFLKNHWTRKA